MSGFVLTEEERAFLLDSRRIVLCTIADNGSARPVPVCFALLERNGRGGGVETGEARDVGGAAREVLYTPLDDKPKRVADPRLLARVRDIQARPEVTLLADRWDEDWENLAWLRLHGTATLLEPEADPERAPTVDSHPPGGARRRRGEHMAAMSALRARYPQYASHDLAARPIIRVLITRAVSWGRFG